MTALRTAAIWLFAVALWAPVAPLFFVLYVGSSEGRTPLARMGAPPASIHWAQGLYFDGLYAVAPPLGRALCAPTDRPHSPACLWATTPAR